MATKPLERTKQCVCQTMTSYPTKAPCFMAKGNPFVTAFMQLPKLIVDGKYQEYDVAEYDPDNSLGNQFEIMRLSLPSIIMSLLMLVMEG